MPSSISPKQRSEWRKLCELAVQYRSGRPVLRPEHALAILDALDEAERALLIAAIPLEVLAAAHKFKPYRELSPSLMAEIDAALTKIRAYIGAEGER